MAEIHTTPQKQTAVRQLLNKLVDNKIFSPSALAWLTIAVDPWHDTSVDNLQGLPDQGIGRSVTFPVTQEYQISKANALPALPSGLWSCRIGNFPKLQNETLSSGNYYGDIVTQSGDSEMLVPVQVNYAPDGADFSDTAVGGTPNAEGCSIPQEYLQGTVKVIAMGIEVVNTTSQLHKQGLMTCVRMTQPDLENFTSYIALPANTWAHKTLVPIRTLPKNLAEMTLYPNLMQNEAKDGYYAPVVSRFNRDTTYPTSKGTLLMTDDPVGGFVAAPIPCHSSKLLPGTVPGNTTVFNASRTNPMFVSTDSNCVMFTGLSDETTLTLRVRWILERFPSDSEKQILVIATPSTPYCPEILEIYSKISQWMPSGAPFTENPAGEWWAKMLGTIGEAAAPLMALIPGLGKFAAPLVTTTAKQLREWGEEQEKDKIKKKQERMLLQQQKQANQLQTKKVVVPANPGPKKPRKRKPKKKTLLVKA